MKQAEVAVEAAAARAEAVAAAAPCPGAEALPESRAGRKASSWSTGACRRGC